VVRAGPEALDLLLDLLLGGQHDDRDVLAALLLGPDLLGHAVAVELRQADVQEDERGALRLPQPDGLVPVARDDDAVAGLLQGVLKQALDVGFVVDDEDLAHLAGFASLPAPLLMLPWTKPENGSTSRVNSVGITNFVAGLLPRALSASRYWRAIVF